MWKLQNVVKRKMVMTMQNGMILKNRNGVRKAKKLVNMTLSHHAKKLVNLAMVEVQLGGMLLGASVPNPWNERPNVLEKRRESLVVLVHYDLMLSDFAEGMVVEEIIFVLEWED